MAGVPEQTVQKWIADGKLPVVASNGGKLVRVEDVQRLAGPTDPETRRDTVPPVPAPGANRGGEPGAAPPLIRDEAATESGPGVNAVIPGPDQLHHAQI